MSDKNFRRNFAISGKYLYLQDELDNIHNISSFICQAIEEKIERERNEYSDFVNPFFLLEVDINNKEELLRKYLNRQREIKAEHKLKNESIEENLLNQGSVGTKKKHRKKTTNAINKEGSNQIREEKEIKQEVIHPVDTPESRKAFYKSLEGITEFRENTEDSSEPKETFTENMENTYNTNSQEVLDKSNQADKNESIDEKESSNSTPQEDKFNPNINFGKTISKDKKRKVLEQYDIKNS